MATTHTRVSEKTRLSTKDMHKLRKPQDPNTKLEKADILEMTVVFLKQQLHPQSPVPQRAHSEGYSFCWRETLHFLSSSSIEDITLQNLQKTSQHVSPSSPLLFQLKHHHMSQVKEATNDDKSVWRP
uniref:BHLH domain-containing protein n=1 Tax=Esox lucius TaxID=8010 RepID=A0AAY5KKT4_ESOLU